MSGKTPPSHIMLYNQRSVTHSYICTIYQEIQPFLLSHRDAFRR